MNTSKNFEKLNNFLNNHYVSKESQAEPTHTELNPGINRGRYRISNNELSIFFELYYNSLEEGGNTLKLIERPKKLSPLKVDFDLRFEKHNDKHMYTENDIQKIVKAYMFEINKYFDIEDSKKIAFVYEIPKPITEIKDNRNHHTYKDGIHIMFPYIVTKSPIQHIIRNNIIENFDNIIDKDKINYINNVNDIVDKSIIDSSGWMMYGSSKSNEREPYKLTKVYQYSSNIIDNQIDLVEDNLDNYSLKDIIELSSIHNKDQETSIISNQIDEVKEYEDKKKNKDINRNIKKYNKIDIDPNVIQRYLDMLLPFRRDNYNSWMEVGLALFNIGDGSEEYLELWDNFSKKSESYQEGCCKRKWDSFTQRDNGLTVGSIKYWAQNDNRNEYLNYTYELGVYNDKISKCLDDDPGDFDISEVLIAIYKDQFVYDPKNSEWYEFSEHRWNNVKKEPFTLLKYISTDIVELFGKCF